MESKETQGPKEIEFLRHAYSRMQIIRYLEERAGELTKGASPAIDGSIHPCAGQEAIPVGAMAALHSDDRIVATYRGHGWAIECGITPFELLAEMCQRQDGVNGGRAVSLMVTDPSRRFVGQTSIVGAGGPIACGIAIAARAQQSGRIAVVSFGDGAVSQGAMHEALVIAASEKLPVIFVCENNGWAEMTPNSYVNPFEISKRAAAYGIAAVTVDGCDPVSVRDAVSEAAQRARSGGGPTFIECKTIRLWGHYNRDIQHYRTLADRESAKALDPISRLRLKLEENGLSADELIAMDKAAEAKIHLAVERALASSLPDLALVRQHLFAATIPAPPSGSTDGKSETMSYASAVNRALHDAMDSRADVLVFGEDVGKPGGVFGLTRNLQKNSARHAFLIRPLRRVRYSVPQWGPPLRVRDRLPRSCSAISCW